MRTLASAIIALALFVSPAVGQDFEKGLAAAARDDYATALREWRPLAERGVINAQYNLGNIYYTGQGVAQDYAEAMKWWRLAAEQGYADAQNNLGIMYYHGQGVAQDYGQALKWYRLAAEQGDIDARFSLGFIYGLGQGVAQNLVQAYVWFTLAEARGHADAAHNRDLVAQRMTPADIASAQRITHDWQSRHGR